MCKIKNRATLFQIRVHRPFFIPYEAWWQGYCMSHYDDIEQVIVDQVDYDPAIREAMGQDWAEGNDLLPQCAEEDTT